MIGSAVIPYLSSLATKQGAGMKAVMLDRHFMAIMICMGVVGILIINTGS